MNKNTLLDKLRKCSRLFLLAFLPIFFCISCASDEPYYKKVRLMTTQDYQAIKLVDNLKRVGVKVFYYGNNFGKNSAVQLFVAENDIFNRDSANFNSRAVSIMDKVIALMDCYDEEVLKVRASIPPVVNNDERYARVLSLARAERVIQYLTSQDINATFVYADNDSKLPGYVEIFFQKFR